MLPEDEYNEALDALKKIGEPKWPRYRVTFDRIVIPKFTKDTDELQTFVDPKDEDKSEEEQALEALKYFGEEKPDPTWDIRWVLTQNAIRDIIDATDRQIMADLNMLSA